MNKKRLYFIEFLFVIVILAIIAIIAIPTITKVVDKARIGAAESSAYAWLFDFAKNCSNYVCNYGLDINTAQGYWVKQKIRMPGLLVQMYVLFHPIMIIQTVAYAQ